MPTKKIHLHRVWMESKGMKIKHYEIKSQGENTIPSKEVHCAELL